MPVFDYQKQAQDYYSKVPAIVLGSGASAAHGMSGMGTLATHLQANTSLSGLAESDLKVWGTSVRCWTLKRILSQPSSR